MILVCGRSRQKDIRPNNKINSGGRAEIESNRNQQPANEKDSKQHVISNAWEMWKPSKSGICEMDLGHHPNVFNISRAEFMPHMKKHEDAKHHPEK